MPAFHGPFIAVVALALLGVGPAPLAHAQAPATYRVTYSGNGSTGGAPVDAKAYAPGATVTVLGNTGNLVETGYLFAGWNTANDGSGATYLGGSTFVMGAADVTLYALWACAPQSSTPPCVAQVPITVQIVNDTDWHDTQVNLLLAGKNVAASYTDPVTGAKTPTLYLFDVAGVPNIDISGPVQPPATRAGPLACPTRRPIPGCVPLARAMASARQPLTVDSPYSGRKGLRVYQFTMSSVSSGALYLSFGKTPISAPPAPTVTAGPRFQPVEFSYSSAIPSNGDLTSIDFFGIPLELTTFPPGDRSYQRPLDRATYYASTPTILGDMIATNPDFQYAFRATDGTRYVLDPLVPDFTGFARVVGPNQVAAAWTSSPIFYPAAPPPAWSGAWPPAGSTGSPWPYPSFASYLEYLVSNGYSFTEADDNVVSAYVFSYTGTILPMTPTTTDTCLPPSLAATGWYVKLTGTTQGAAPLPDSMDICLPLPASGSAASGSGDFFIYGAAQNCESIVLYSPSSGIQPCTDANAARLGAIANSVYGWIQADVLAALSFGYLKGAADKTWGGPNGTDGASGVWYGLPPIQYPFGAARLVNDGYYNPWAAFMYRHSDAYGFAFSDRNGRPSPDIAFPVGGTLRIWILPDTRLDAPRARVTATGGHSVTLSWQVVAGADHYVVTRSPPYQTASTSVAQPAAGASVVTTRIGGLDGGTAYRFTVRAVNADGSQGSTEIPVHATTLGAQPTAAAGNASFNFGFNWTPPAHLGSVPELWVGGTRAAYAVNAGSGTYTIANPGLPINVGPPAASAPLTVTPAAAGGSPYITATIAPTTIAPGGSATLTVSLNNPTASALTPSGFAVPIPAGVTAAVQSASSTCVGPVVTPDDVIAIGVTTIAAGGNCTIAASLASSTPGTVIVQTPPMQTQSGTLPPVTVAAPASAPLIVSGESSAVAMSIAPSTIVAGGQATLTITLANATASAQTLDQEFASALPPGVVVVSLGTPATACPQVGFDPTATLISMAKGAAIPPGGCQIVATIAAATTPAEPGSYTLTTGTLLTDATAYPVRAFPLELRFAETAPLQAGETIWSATAYLTFLGVPWSYSVGPCLPDDECIGGAPTVLPGTVLFDTRRSPNLLQRQDPATGLSIAGPYLAPVLGPPFGTTVPAVPTIGVSFAPVADKQLSEVVYPGQ